MAYKRSAPNPLLLPLLLVVIIAGAMVAVTLMKKKETQAAAEEQEEEVASPFDDLPDELPPDRTVDTGARSVSGKRNKAPDLTNNPYASEETFASHVEKTVEAEELYQDAVAALEESDHSTFHKKGYEARKLFEKAIEETAEYEASLIAEHGDIDTDVRGIVQMRSFWEERRLFLHKMTR